MSLLRAGQVAVVGRPNAGKSTLVNRLVGDKVAIVSPRPQTTRHMLRGVIRRPDLYLELMDTPGVHKPLHRMNQAMMDAVESSLAAAHVACAVVDASVPGGAGTRFLFDLLRRVETPAVLALNKIDLVSRPLLLPLIAELDAEGLFAALVPLSARSGDGVDRLVTELALRLPEVVELPADDPGRPGIAFQAAEEIREALLERCGQELPYVSAVRVDGIQQNERGVRVVGTVVVEKEGQKRIVVGRGGLMIRDIGTQARHALANRLGVAVHLDLQVIVEAGWRESRRFLSDLPQPQGLLEHLIGPAGGDADDDEPHGGGDGRLP